MSSSSDITITIRTVTSPLTLSLNPSTTTISDLKSRLVTLTSIPIDSQRLVYAGKILDINTSTLEEYGITQNGVTIHLARAAANTQLPPSTTSPTTSSLPGSGLPTGSNPAAMLRQLSSNPFIASMLSNPELIRSMMRSSPEIQRLRQQNPEIDSLINSDSFINDMSRMMSNPAAMEEAMRHQDRALLNVENIPGGFNLLSSMFGSMQGTRGEEGASGPTRRELEEDEERNREFARRLGVEQVANDPNAALPNPWAAPRANTTSPTSMPMSMPPMGFPFAFPAPQQSGQSNAMNPLMGMMNMMNAAQGQNQGQNQQSPFQQAMFSPFFMPPFGGMMPPVQQLATQTTPATTTPAEPQPNYDQQFAEQLQQLSDLGFSDKPKNIRALLLAGGNVESAINVLLDGL